MNRSKAYWIHCNGESDYVGPLNIQVEQGKGLDFGEILVEEKLRITNNSNEASNISLNVLASSQNGPSADGDVSISRWIPLPDEKSDGARLMDWYPCITTWMRIMQTLFRKHTMCDQNYKTGIYRHRSYKSKSINCRLGR